MKNLAKVMALFGCALLTGEMSVAVSQQLETTLTTYFGDAPATNIAIDPAGNLYGLTIGNTQDSGTVYELVRKSDANFEYKTLYSFGANGADDGLDPAQTATLVLDSNGNLYGTTNAGGAHGLGTVFEVSPASGGSWTEKVLYSFGDNVSADGKGIPNGTLLLMPDGSLFGTTTKGGVHNTGSIFQLSANPDGTWGETVIHSFPAGSDTSQIISPLVYYFGDGLILGALQSGNLHSAIFVLVASGDGSWTYSIAHDFTPASGNVRLSGPIVVTPGATVYGTYVWDGGPAGSNSGTVYQLSDFANGWFVTATYDFPQDSGQYPTANGELPLGGVTMDAHGVLFGSTRVGGDYNIGGVFQLTPPINETHVGEPFSESFFYSFGDFAGPGSDVWEPVGNLVLDSVGNLYGTATYHVSGNTGLGQAFEVNYGRSAISPPSIDFDASSDVVSISETTPNVTVHYTLNGSTPTLASPIYPGPFTINSTKTVQAIAVNQNNAQSNVTVRDCVFTPLPNSPDIYPPPGTYSSAQNLLLTTGPQTVPGSATSIYYTTDGSSPIVISSNMAYPSSTAKLYDQLIPITQSETFNVVAISANVASHIVTASYQIASPAGTPSYPAGAISASLLVLNRGAQVIAGQLHLTDDFAPEARSAWFNSKVYVGSFITDFDFQQYNDGSLGDGLTFTIQNQGANAFGSAGAGLGYQGITKSVAVKFDLYGDVVSNDGVGPGYTGLYTNGAAPTVPAVNLAGNLVNLTDGHPMHAHITYNGATLILSITDLSTGAHQTHNFPVNIQQTIGTDTAYIGFTGSTGDGADRQNITSWSYQPLGASVVVMKPTIINFPGAVSTVLTSINAGGSIAGNYVDASAATHAFIRDSLGNFTNIDPPAATSSQAFAINSSGTVLGYGAGHNFLRDSAGNYTNIDFTDSDYEGDTCSWSVVALNDSGAVVGDCSILIDQYDGYYYEEIVLRNPDGTFQTYPGNNVAQPTGFNNKGQIVGVITCFCSDDGPVFGQFLINPDGSGGLYSPAQYLTPAAINDSGVIVGGYYYQGSGYEQISSQGFERDASGNFTLFDVGIPTGINNMGVIIGPNFIISPDGTVNTVSLSPTAINDSGMVIGTYQNSAGKSRGFLWKCGLDGKACAGF